MAEGSITCSQKHLRGSPTTKTLQNKPNTLSYQISSVKYKIQQFQNILETAFVHMRRAELSHMLDEMCIAACLLQ